jgi:hypothetical protein
VTTPIFLGIYAILKQKSKQNFSWEMIEPAGFFKKYLKSDYSIGSGTARNERKHRPF